MIDLSTGQVKPSADDICSDLTSDISSQLGSLDSIISDIRTGTLNDVKGTLSDLVNNGTISDVDGLIDSASGTVDGGLGGLSDLVNDTANGKVGDRSIQSILDCINSLTGMNNKIPQLSLPSMPTVGNLGGMANDVTGALFSYLSDLFTDNLDPYQNMAADALEALAGLIPNDLIDKLLHLLQCLEDCVGATPPIEKPGAQLYDVWCYDERKGFKVWAEDVHSMDDISCPNSDQHKISYSLSDPLPTGIEVENSLYDIGLNLDGSPDFTSPTWSEVGITDSIGQNLSKLTDAKINFNEMLTEATDIDILGSIPELPEIPRLPNPLEGLSLTEKISKLF